MEKVRLGSPWVILVLLSAVLILISTLPRPTSPQMQIPFSEVEVPGEVPGVDTDGDGLKDLQEDSNMNGVMDHFEISPTSPIRSDTDGDGLDDGEEYRYWSERAASPPPETLLKISEIFTGEDSEALLLPRGDLDSDGLPNIIDPDSDSDGLLDGQEIKMGLDPASPDSDGDTVPDGEEEYQGIKDEDGDGIDDLWERYWRVNGDDEDGDGIDDLQEYLNGTSPRHPDGVAPEALKYTEVRWRSHLPPGPVFLTSSSLPLYYRVFVFTGLDDGGWRAVRPALSPPVNATQTIKITFYSPSPGVVPTPYGGVEIIGARRPTWLYGDDGVERKRINSTYLLNVTLVYSPWNYTEDDLKGLNTTRLGVATEYLEKPRGLPQAITTMAVEVSLKGRSDCERAMLIASYLRGELRYYPESELRTYQPDDLFRFLFVERRGDDLDFSTAYVILLRVMGIPARVVEGYVLGEKASSGRMFRGLHHHYWAEFYLEGAGWVPVEVTPPYLGRDTGSRGRVEGRDPALLLGGDGGGLFTGSATYALSPDGDADSDGLNNSLEEKLGTSPYLVDTDSDGLTDREELSLGTDPLRADTDGDSLTDGEEVNVYSTDPLKSDTDGGGVNDGVEVMRSMNPLDGSDDLHVSDPDGDLLPSTIEEIIGTDPLKADTDSDGLTDGEEYTFYLSNPLKADTDSDGLTDGEEVHVYHTSPISGDTDGDGLGDEQEVKGGTSPLRPDTDSDGLTDGEEMLLYVTDPQKPDTDSDGLTDGREVILGTSPLNPDSDSDGIEDSVEVLFGWDPLDGEIPQVPPPLDRDSDNLPDRYEVLMGTDPLKADTDSDGLTDGEEVLIYGTSPTATDTDGDHLSDAEEAKLGTNPLLNDTDSDGLTDAKEGAIGTDPLNPDTDSDGLTDGDEILFRTSPIKCDTDGGGVKDGIEVLLGMNPLSPTDDTYLPDRDRDGLPDVGEMEEHTNVSNPDTDGDGLADGEEVLLSTDPLNPDTDGDCVEDGEEVRGGTSPVRADTDSDGLTDGRELQIGTDPNIRDSDGDGLVDGKEVETGSDPRAFDTDGDGLADGMEGWIWSEGPLNATDPDTDGGGVDDLMEVMLGSDPLEGSDDAGYIDGDDDFLPDDVEALKGTNATDPDTDGDGLADGEEVYLGTDPLRSDTDGDGLNDSEEVYLGTDPLRSDTDGDGLADEEEVYLGTDPLRSDTDGDGLNDSEEVELGTDPLKVDSDSDGLTDAMERRIGTSPTEPDTDGGGARDGDEYMNGGDPKDPLDDWRWVDTDEDGLPDWREAVEGTDPLRSDTDGDGLNDSEEVDMGTDPLLNDTDNDGLNDGDEIKYGTDPFLPDTDHDGIDDGDEVLLGTDPLKADSDSDGLSDHDEDTLGTDPLNPDTDGDGLTDGSELLRDLDPGREGVQGTDPLKSDTDGGGMDDYEEEKNSLNPLDPSDDRYYLDDDNDGLLNWEEMEIYHERTDGDLNGDKIVDHYTFPGNPDSDSDGLTDGEEMYLYGTEPLVADTDGDGLMDGEEVKVFLTDPLNPDTDGDTLTDGREIHFDVRTLVEGFRSFVDWEGDGEVNYNTDPLLVDTDGGGEGDMQEILHYRNPLDPSDDVADPSSSGVVDVSVVEYPSRIVVNGESLNEWIRGSVTIGGGGSARSLILEAYLVPSSRVSGELIDYLSTPDASNYRVGSGRCSEDGTFTIKLFAPNRGEVGENYLIVYVGGVGGAEGKVHVVSTVEVTSSTRITLDLPDVIFSGDTLLVRGSLRDFWGAGVVDEMLTLRWGESESEIQTSSSGIFSYMFTAPHTPGVVAFRVEYPGDEHYLPTNLSKDVVILSSNITLRLSVEGEEFFAYRGMNFTITIDGYRGELGALKGYLSLTTAEGEVYKVWEGEVSSPTFKGSTILEVPPGRYRPSIRLTNPHLPADLWGTSGWITVKRGLVLRAPFLLVPRGERVRVSCLVLDLSGTPVEGVEVSLYVPEEAGGVISTGMSGVDGSVELFLALPGDTPLGHYTATAVLTAQDPFTPLKKLTLPLVVASRVFFSNLTYPDWISKEKPLTVSGRLLNDRGSPLQGSDCVSLKLGDRILATASTDEVGTFYITTPPPPYLNPGVHTFLLSFTGFSDQRAGLYLQEKIPIRVDLLLQTHITLKYRIEGGSLVGNLTLVNENGEGVGGARVSLKTPGQHMVVVTDNGGCSRIYLKLPEKGVFEVVVSYSGNMSRHLSPSEERWRIRVSGEAEGGTTWMGYLIWGLSVFLVGLVILQAYLYFRKLRPLKEARRIARHRELYAFDEAGLRKKIFAIYREFEKRAEVRGYRRKSDETLREYFERLKRHGYSGRNLERALPHLERAMYSNDPLSKNAVEEVEGLLEGGGGE